MNNKNTYNALMIMTWILLNVSYIVVNIQFPIITNTPLIILNMFFNKYNIIFTPLSFMISSSILFYTIIDIKIKYLFSVCKSLIILCLVINPFTLKYIMEPVSNIAYSLVIYFIFNSYFILLKTKENNLVLFFFLVLPISLIFPYAIIITTQILLLDYLYNIFSNKTDKKPLYHIAFIMLIIYFIVFNIAWKDLNDFSDDLSFAYFSFINMSLSIWLIFLIFSIIGFFLYFIINIKKNINILNFLIYLIFIPVGCLSFSFNSFNYPFFILLLGFSFFNIRQISSRYSQVFTIMFITLTLSSFFSTLNNYKMQMIFSNNIIESINKKIEYNSTYYIINNVAYSPIIKGNSIYPYKYWDSLYLKNSSWNNIKGNKNVIFIYKNQDFLIDRLSNDFYLQSYENDNKYYSLIKKDGFSYIFFKKT